MTPLSAYGTNVVGVLVDLEFKQGVMEKYRSWHVASPHCAVVAAPTFEVYGVFVAARLFSEEYFGWWRLAPRGTSKRSPTKTVFSFSSVPGAVISL